MTSGFLLNKRHYVSKPYLCEVKEVVSSCNQCENIRKHIIFRKTAARYDRQCRK